MPHTKLLALAALSAAIGFLPAPAQSASASVSTQGFSYELIDLDGADGITPTISFRYEGIALRSYLLEKPWETVAREEVTGYGTLEYTSELGHADANAGMDRVSANASAIPSGMVMGVRAVTAIEFDLTPRTTVVFHVPYSVSVTERLSEGGDAVFYFDGTLGNRYDSFSLEDRLRVTASRAGSLTGELSSGDSGINGRLDLYAIAVALAVPEPSSYAMWLSGLGVLGTVAWRGRRLDVPRPPSPRAA